MIVEVLKITDKFESDENDVTNLLINRPKLKKYMGLGYLDFHAVYGHMSTRHDGTDVACLKNVRDPLTHDIVTDHAWVVLHKPVVQTLEKLKRDTPVRVRAKVILYDRDTKIGLRPAYINLVRGQRNYTIPSVVVNGKKQLKKDTRKNG